MEHSLPLRPVGERVQDDDDDDVDDYAIAQAKVPKQLASNYANILGNVNKSTVKYLTVVLCLVCLGLP